MSTKDQKKNRSILLKPLYRYRYSNARAEHYNNHTNDYHVIQRIVSPSHDCEAFHSPGFLEENNEEKDPLQSIGLLGEVEVTMEEYCGPLRSGFANGGISGTGSNEAYETLWRRVAVRGAGGSILHRTFALPSSTNDEFSLPSNYNNTSLESKTLVHQDPIMCWTSFATSRNEIPKNANIEEVTIKPPAYTNEKKFLCVLALPTLLRIFDLQPYSSSSQSNHNITQQKSQSASQDKYTSNDSSTLGTEGGEGHVISLPFEATSIFSIEGNYHGNYERNITQGGLLLQRTATQEDFFVWNQFQVSQSRYPTIHYTQSQEDSPIPQNARKPKHNFTDEDEDDDECNISGPPHPVRLRNVFKPDLSDSPSKPIHISSSTQPFYYEDHPNDSFPYTPSSVTSMFSIRHPSDDIRPIALLAPHMPSISTPTLSSTLPPPTSTSGPESIVNASSTTPPPLFADAHEQILFLGCPKSNNNASDLPNICVTYHSQIKRHAVWIFKRAPPPPPIVPLWKRTADATSEKKIRLQKMKHNMDIVVEEGRDKIGDSHINEHSTHDFFTSNTTTASNVKLSPLSHNIHSEEKIEESTGSKKNLNVSPFSDIHPDYGLSLLWTEQPSFMSNFDDPSYPPGLACGSSSENTQASTGTVSLSRAQHVFLSSDMNKSLTYLCLVCPNPSLTHTHQKRSSSDESDSNPLILRCLGINLLSLDKTTTQNHPASLQNLCEEYACKDSANIIQSISHKVDLPCVSAQPITSSNAIDILVCSILKGEKSLKLYRGEYFICDCTLPPGGKFASERHYENYRSKSDEEKVPTRTFKMKGKNSSFNSSKTIRSALGSLDLNSEEFGNVESLAYPSYNRIDIICEASRTKERKLSSDNSQLFTIRSSLSLCMLSSPLAEAILLAIDSSSFIPKEFSLQLRVDCIRILQELPNLHSSIGMGYMDPEWKAVSIAILAIIDAFLKKEIGKSSLIRYNDEFIDANSGDEDENDDWNFLIESEFHQMYSLENASLFAFEKNLRHSKSEKDNRVMKPQGVRITHGIEELTCLSQRTPLTLELCSSIFEALHFVYEDSKLNRVSRGEKWIQPLGTLLRDITRRSNGGMDDYFQHYCRDIGFEEYRLSSEINTLVSEFENPFRFSRFKHTPSFLDWVEHMLLGYDLDDSVYEAYFNSTPRDLNPSCVSTRKIHRLYSILFGPTKVDSETIISSSSRSITENVKHLSSSSPSLSNTRIRDERLVLAMVQEGMTNLSELINELPVGIILPIMESLHRCRNHPPRSFSNWPPSAYQLIGRSDLAEMESCKRGLKDKPAISSIAARFRGSYGDEQVSPSSGLQADREQDGLQPLEMFSSMIFPNDRRIREAARLLRSSRPTYLRVERAPEVSDHDHEGLKQEKLLLLCRRVLANALGRGMLTYGTLELVLTDPIPIPKLCLAGRVPPSNATLNLDISSCPDDMKIWPEFHNGVAAGLRMRMQESCGPYGSMRKITRTWILYNKPNPQQTNTSSSQAHGNNNANSNAPSDRTDNSHGGFLLALGLRGQLSTLAMTDIYEYLTQGGVTTTVGILLGMAATKRSTCDPSVSKMLCLHIPSLLPPSFSVMDIASTAQAAAIAGIGLLYQESSHRLMTEFLLNEMGKKPTSDFSTRDREGYTLACGLALGMVNLSTKETSEKQQSHRIGAGLADLHIEERLHRYIVGGNDDADARLKREDAERSNTVGSNSGEPERCSRIYEGSTINTDVTAPGATLALGLIYLKSGNFAVASSLNLPDTHFLLDYVRPDLLMYRVISKSLILWDYVSASPEWIDAQIPVVVKKSFSELEKRALRASNFIGMLKDPSRADQQGEVGKPISKDSSVDRQAVRQIYAHVVAGACFGMGLRFAGTANSDAASAISERIRRFRKLRDDNDPVSVAQRPERPILEMCLGCATIALAMVMAGTGDVETMRLLRELRWRCDEDVRYGNHMAYGATIGMLFLGGGSSTLGREPADIAALLMAFFPRFPAHTSDNQYHLQALRHCYVLATRNRELEAIDVDTREPVYIPFEVSDRMRVQCYTYFLIYLIFVFIIFE